MTKPLLLRSRTFEAGFNINPEVESALSAAAGEEDEPGSSPSNANDRADFLGMLNDCSRWRPGSGMAREGVTVKHAIRFNAFAGFV